MSFDKTFDLTAGVYFDFDDIYEYTLSGNINNILFVRTWYVIVERFCLYLRIEVAKKYTRCA